MAIEQWMRRVYSAKSGEELARVYDEWSGEYELDAQRYSPNKTLVAGMVGRYLPKNTGVILDAGCGTGVMGEILKLMGHDNLVGIDISQGMLNIAAQKDAYIELKRMALGRPLSFDTAYFAATLAVGVLSVAQGPPDALDEIIRVTKPNGLVIFTLNELAYEQCGFKGKLAELDLAGSWKLEERSDYYQGAPNPSGESLGTRVFVYRTR